MVAPPNEMGELGDVFLLDAPVPAGGAGAGQEAGGRPAADGMRRHAEAASGQLYAQVHGQTVPGNPTVVNVREV
jgi:hypothetical protein